MILWLSLIGLIGGGVVWKAFHWFKVTKSHTKNFKSGRIVLKSEEGEDGGWMNRKTVIQIDDLQSVERKGVDHPLEDFIGEGSSKWGKNQFVPKNCCCED